MKTKLLGLGLIGAALCGCGAEIPPAQNESSSLKQSQTAKESSSADRYQENYLNEYDVTFDVFMYPALSNPDLKTEALENCNQTDLSIARNQLFAKYGRRFEDPFLNAIFAQKSGDYNTFSALLSGSSADLDGDSVQERIYLGCTKDGSWLLAAAEYGSAEDFDAGKASEEWKECRIEFYQYINGVLTSLGTVESYPECMQLSDGKLTVREKTREGQEWVVYALTGEGIGDKRDV